MKHPRIARLFVCALLVPALDTFAQCTTSLTPEWNETDVEVKVSARASVTAGALFDRKRISVF